MLSAIVIAGPTASGKTAAAIEVAQQLGTSIISADSRQCYRELNIGVARPSEEELQAVPHHFIASHSIHEKIHAAGFESYALNIATSLFQQHEQIVMVGGTGLYIKAFCEGMDPMPEIPASVREEVTTAYEQHGLPWLQEQIALLDPQFHASGETRNPHRMMRALEVVRATGRSILDFRTAKKTPRPFQSIRFAIDLPKEELHRNIDTRVDRMMDMGLEAEVRSLIPYRHLNALQTVGYKELFSYFDGAISLDEAVMLIKRNTRQYAKRQLTWFRRDKTYQWLKPGALVREIVKLSSG